MSVLPEKLLIDDGARDFSNAATRYWQALPDPIVCSSLDNLNVTPFSLFKEDRWEIPLEWLPPSQRQKRWLTFENDLPDHFKEICKRVIYVVLRGLQKGRRGRRIQASASTAYHWNIKVKRISRYIAAKGYGRFSEVPSSIFLEMLKEFSAMAQPQTVETYRWKLEVLVALGQQGILKDWPQLDQRTSPFETSYSSGSVFVAEKEDSYLPIPEQDLLRLVTFARYFAVRLGPVLPKVYAHCLAMEHPDPMPLSRMRSSYIQSLAWGQLDRSVQLDVWPPQSFQHVWMLVRLLQASIYVLIAACTGLRISEVLGIRSGCLRPMSEGKYYLYTRIYKTDEDLIGEEIDFPVVQDVADAIGQLEEMSSAIAPYVGQRTGLFFCLVTHQTPICDTTNAYLLELCDVAQIEGVTTHRFRPSLARLCALTLTEAPKILQRLWQHADVDTTLGYMMGIPGFAEELAEQANRERVLRGRRIYHAASDCGGGAAPAVRLAAEAAKIDAVAQGVDPVVRFMDRLLKAGVALRAIYPNVICVKAPGQIGRCGTGGDGIPSLCELDCSFHLELPERRAVVRDTVNYLVSQLQQAEVVDNRLLTRCYGMDLVRFALVFDDIWLEFRECAEVVRALAQIARVPAAEGAQGLLARVRTEPRTIVNGKAKRRGRRRENENPNDC
jgi:hypothetical protein